MKPDLSTVLNLLADRIRDDALPALGDSYAAAQLQRGLQLLAAASSEIDRAADWRAQELEALRALFRNSAAALDDVDLAQALRLEAAEPCTSLRLGELDLRLHRMRGLLIRLHIWCEGHDSPEAKALEQAVWTELRLSTERRRLSVDRF